MFLNEAISKSIEQIYTDVKSAPDMNMEGLPKGKAALIIVDMVNGFVKQGALSSPRVLAINKTVAKIALRSEANDIPILALADCHSKGSAEFSAFPEHCLSDDIESKLTDEIAAVGNIKVINKNSINGFLADEFKQWVDDNPQIEIYIITGCCTDLCVNQLALTMKAYFNSQNKNVRIVIPMDAVETYDSENHNAKLCNLMALYNMKLNAIELVTDIN